MNINKKNLKLSEKDKLIILKNSNICTDSHGLHCLNEKTDSAGKELSCQ